MRWYEAQRRALPWRDPRPDPYRVWVSEIMLQQTQVATVIPYFERFIGRFPNVRALARSSLDAVLGEWAGLGYYRRAHHLHGAARVIVERHRGVIPSDVSALRALPGVGRYTAGAIASIAFGQRVAAVDGNVRRVLSRYFGGEGSRGPDRAWEVAAALVPADRPGEFNQALMELGATVCRPTLPRCAECPLRRGCGTANGGPSVGARRRAGASKAGKPVLEVAALVIRERGRALLERRGSSGLWAGLWDFPQTASREGEAPADAAARLLEQLELTAAPPTFIATVTRELTHRRLVAHVCATELRRPDSRRHGPSVETTWVDPDRDGPAMSAAARAIWRAAREGGSSGGGGNGSPGGRMASAH